MSEKFNPRKDAIFGVLNDWLEVSTEQFNRFWEELDEATKVEDVVKLDPEPWVTLNGSRLKEPTAGDALFLPRTGYSHTQADYPQP